MMIIIIIMLIIIIVLDFSRKAIFQNIQYLFKGAVAASGEVARGPTSRGGADQAGETQPNSSGIKDNG